jgi:hypothetical protein
MATPLHAQATLGRSRGPEPWFQQAFTPLAQNQIPKPLNLARPLEALIFNWRGRVVIGTANYAAVAAEAPWTIIQRIRITGTYKGQFLVPVDISGATLFALRRLFEAKGNNAYIGTTLQAELSSPLAQTLANFGNTGTYDLDLYYTLPMAPIIAIANRRWDLPRYFWQSKDWSDSIQVQIYFGDATSFGTPGGSTTTTFTAFGSGAGSPTCNIYTCYSILGQFRSGFKTACVLRTESPVSGVVTALATATRLTPLQKGSPTTNVILKSGLALAGSSAGVQVFASLSDTILDVTQIVNDNNPVRNNQDNRVFKEWMSRQFQTILPQGYLHESFIDSQTTRTAYRSDLPAVVASGADFAIYSNIVTANAATLVTFIQEQIVKESPDPYWDGTR